MGEPIENLYFNWLCAKVLPIDVRNHYELMRILYSTEFIWVIERDSNRAADGIELRTYFLRESGVEKDYSWFEAPCSVLEVFIAFANRASFDTDEPSRDWFWRILGNLGLDDYRQVSPEDRPVIEEILNTFLWRTYDYNGNGGMFPMRHTDHDQRKLEIWYQFCEYLEEQGL